MKPYTRKKFFKMVSDNVSGNKPICCNLDCSRCIYDNECFEIHINNDTKFEVNDKLDKLILNELRKEKIKEILK